ncbi:DUF2271 domain-containing protein [Pseudoxanthomonas jiangsuensis]|uniref:DUF2271 domain-containing protein n=1 Tax=Pseudoxanthomonas jiangsuensis TaxID=619688 RepID=UPI001391E5CF|nr:DUF2271 domain-containing protein [Pseudoxanthomonas jiangsuensis]
MRAHRGRAWPLALAAALACVSPAAVAVERHHREPVLGTSLDLQLAGVDAATGERMLAAALDEIAAHEAVLSGWRGDSALSRLNAGTPVAGPPPALREVLRACEQWRARTAGAFSCRLGSLAQAWRQADADGVLPSRPELRRQARELAKAPFDPQAPVLAAPPGRRFDVDGIAKGWILDRVLLRLRTELPQARGIAMDIGGDGAYWGRDDDGRPWQVAVADPLAPRDNHDVRGIARLRLDDAAMASSGHASRGYAVGRRQFSHILDPLEGWPVAYAPSATVVAADAATADALATALTVMPIREGLALVDSLPGTAALVVGEQGVAFASAAWPARLEPDEAGRVPQRDGQACTLQVDYTIPQRPADRYRNPYLALWIARPDGTPVRQLLVLGDRSRWLGELPAWWRHYGRNDNAAALGIARPTRRPGAYSVGWDGRDDFGRAVAQGDYLLQAEAAREHGGHETLSLPFAWRARTRAANAQGGSEIGRIELRQACRPG